MVFIDRPTLLGEMRKRNITQKQLAKLIGITPQALNLKLKEKRQFAEGELAIIYKTFGKCVFFLD